MDAPSRISRTRQAGSVLITTAIALSVIVIALIGTELGYLFYLKRDLQKTADLAALAGAQALQADNCGNAVGKARSNATTNLPAGLQPLTTTTVLCGRWDPVRLVDEPHFGPPLASERFNAIRVNIRSEPTLLIPGIPGNQRRAIEVQALAAQKQPRAALNIRSTLLTVKDSQSALLNAVIGGMLGGTLNLGVGSWQGLVTANIKLLSFLDQLGVDLDLGVGKYDEVLSKELQVGTLLQAMIHVLERQGNTASVAITALGEIKTSLNLVKLQPVVKLGQLLGVQTGTDAAGLDAELQVFQLFQGVVQLANKKNGLAADVQILPGITAHVGVIEPPQLSAIGDPTLATLAPDGPDRIYVRTAQVRTLISIDLPVLNGVTDLLNAVTTLLSPVTTLLNKLLGLKLDLLSDVLSCTLVCTKDVTDVDILPAPLRLDISLDAGGGDSRVTGFSCSAGARSLSARTTTSVANLRIGKIAETAALAKVAAFSPSVPLTVSPVPVIDIGSLKCTRLLLGLIPVSCDESKRIAFQGGGLGLKADVPIASNTKTQIFENPPELNEAPIYSSIDTKNLVESLNGTLHGLNMITTIPPKAPGGGLSDVLTALTDTLSGVINVLKDTVAKLLSPLLDPLLNTLLGPLLGINLAVMEVGGRLSCSSGAELVF
jgi:uncharacterized membrane protein